MTAPKLTEAQRVCLTVFANGDGPGESWALYFDGRGSASLAWSNHERMMKSLMRRGLLDSKGVTDAGRAALRGES